MSDELREAALARLDAWAGSVRRLIEAGSATAAINETGIPYRNHSTPPERRAIKDEALGVIDRWLERDRAALAARPDSPTLDVWQQRLVKAAFENTCGDLACQTRRTSAAVRVLTGVHEHADAAWAVETFEAEAGARDPETVGPEPYLAAEAALAAHRVEPAPTLDERARVERDARLRDARDALDMAALWLHRTFDLPARDSQQAESWERKARSGRVALAATPAPTLDVERLERVLRYIHGNSVPFPVRRTPEEYAAFIVECDARLTADTPSSDTPGATLP